MNRKTVTREELIAAAYRLAVARHQVTTTIHVLRDGPVTRLRRVWKAYHAIDGARADIDALWCRQFPREESPVYPADEAVRLLTERQPELTKGSETP